MAISNYGYLAGFLEHPEIGPILQRAAAEGWTKEVLQGAVYKTEWWQHTSASAREWEVLKASDPAEVDQQRTARSTQLNLLAAQSGFTLDPSLVNGMVEMSLAGNWDDQMQRWMLFSAAEYTGTTPIGVAGQRMDEFKKSASDYGVAISDAQAFQWARGMLRGDVTQEAVDVSLRQLAKSAFPHLANEIDRGLTVKDVATPYLEQAGRLLERNPVDMDFRDDRWRKMLDVVGSDGARRAMTLSEAQTYVKKMDDYDFTRNAMTEVSILGEGILKAFGKVAG